jgi:hypothetical protein
MLSDWGRAQEGGPALTKGDVLLDKQSLLLTQLCADMQSERPSMTQAHGKHCGASRNQSPSTPGRVITTKGL